jgi:hypothetical protein
MAVIFTGIIFNNEREIINPMKDPVLQGYALLPRKELVYATDKF